MGLARIDAPDKRRGMAIAWVVVDSERAAVEQEMSAQGFTRWIRATVSDKERLYTLPPGLYWMAEPSDERDLLDRCRAAVKAAGVVSARIVVVSGPAAWDGLAVAEG